MAIVGILITDKVRSKLDADYDYGGPRKYATLDQALNAAKKLRGKEAKRKQRDAERDAAWTYILSQPDARALGTRELMEDAGYKLVKLSKCDLDAPTPHCAVPGNRYCHAHLANPIGDAIKEKLRNDFARSFDGPGTQEILHESQDRNRCPNCGR